MTRGLDPVGKHSSRRAKGTAAIVVGAVIALGGGAAIAHGLMQDDTDDPASFSAVGTSSNPGTSARSDGATSPSGSSSGSSSARHSSGPSKSGTKKKHSANSSRRATVPEPKSHSKQANIANPTGAACIPKHLTVSSVGINERVVPMGTNAQGQIYPPAHTTMWYNRSTQPGQDGISVIAGHVTYDGPDNFYNLRNVPVGANVNVTCTNGKSVTLRVTHKESILKTDLTTDQRVWGGSSTPVVTLITCDIKSPKVAGHHLSNYVVWTKPA